MAIFTLVVNNKSVIIQQNVPDAERMLTSFGESTYNN